MWVTKFPKTAIALLAVGTVTTLLIGFRALSRYEVSKYNRFEKEAEVLLKLRKDAEKAKELAARSKSSKES